MTKDHNLQYHQGRTGAPEETDTDVSQAECWFDVTSTPIYNAHGDQGWNWEDKKPLQGPRPPRGLCKQTSSFRMHQITLMTLSLSGHIVFAQSYFWPSLCHFKTENAFVLHFFNSTWQTLNGIFSVHTFKVIFLFVWNSVNWF